MTGAEGANRPATGPDPSDPGSTHSAAESAPDLFESFRQVHAAGRASAGAVSDVGKSFRSLLAADVSLARSAFGRAVAFTGLAVAFGASAWLLLMATVILVLRMRLGMAWSLAMLICAGLSLVIAALAAWMAMRYFEHTRLKATRRQLARLGIGELSHFTPSPGSARSAKDATENVELKDSNGAPAKDTRGIEVTPP